MAWLDRGWYLVIEFEKSTSGLFKDALRLAQAHPSYCQLMDHRGHVFHRVVMREDDLAQAMELLELIQNWSHARTYFRGDELESSVARSQLECYAWRLSAGGLCTCRLLPEGGWAFPASLGCGWDAVQLQWLGGSRSDGIRHWFHCGRMEKNRLLVVDKDRLWSRVESEIAAHGACPMLDSAAIEQIVRRLPETIDVRREPAWRLLNVRELHRVISRPHFPSYLKELPPVLPRSPEAYDRYMARLLDGLEWQRPQVAELTAAGS